MNKLLGEDADKVKTPMPKSNENLNDNKINNIILKSHNNDIFNKEQTINIDEVKETKEKTNLEDNKPENKPQPAIGNLEGNGIIMIDQNENNEFLNKLGSDDEEEEEDD